MTEDGVHRDGKGAGCWMGVWCGRHCKAVNARGNACIRPIHFGHDHAWGWAPCRSDGLRLVEPEGEKTKP